MGFLDLPDQPDPPGRPERASVSGADRPTSAGQIASSDVAGGARDG